jgi:hypothetical protein
MLRGYAGSKASPCGDRRNGRLQQELAPRGRRVPRRAVRQALAVPTRDREDRPSRRAKALSWPRRESCAHGNSGKTHASELSFALGPQIRHGNRPTAPIAGLPSLASLRGSCPFSRFGPNEGIVSLNAERSEADVPNRGSRPDTTELPRSPDAKANADDRRLASAPQSPRIGHDWAAVRTEPGTNRIKQASAGRADAPESVDELALRPPKPWHAARSATCRTVDYTYRRVVHEEVP